MIIRLHNVYAHVVDATPHEETWLSRFLRFDDTRDQFYRDSSGKVQRKDPVKASLWDRRARTYPAGLTAKLIRGAEAAGHQVDIVDTRVRPPGFVRTFAELDPMVLAAIDYLRDYQRDAVERILRRTRGIIQIPTAGGKCLGKGTPVLMADGRVLPVEQVAVGDRVMGPDGMARTVQSTTTGNDEMFEIVPHRGEAWTCNAQHQLTLVHTATGRLLDIELQDYLSRSKWFKHCHKLLTTDEPVEFDRPFTPSSITVDPYFVGVWLGDGKKDLRGVNVTKPDQEILGLCRDTAKRWGLEWRLDYRDGSPHTSRIVAPRGTKNPLLDALRTLMASGVRVPATYRYGPVNVRAAVLAGLLDTDGHLKESGDGFDFVQKRSDLFEDTVFIARSLGLRATTSVKIVNGETYYRAYICGDFSSVPLRISRKQCNERTARKAHNRSGFAVRPAGRGAYYGFKVDGDGRFLLGDFTVTHNSELPPSLVALIPGKWLFVVPAGDLMHDIANRIEERCGVAVGRIGDKHWTTEDVTVATIQSLGAALRPVGRSSSKRAQDKHDRVKKLLAEADGLFVDEVHRLPADQAYHVAMQCNAYVRIGVSATPMDRTDKRSVFAVGALGELIYRITPQELIDQGFISRPKIRFVPCEQAGPQTRDYGHAYRALVVNSRKRNALIGAALRKAPKPAFVFVKLLKHGRELTKALRAEGHKVEFVRGSTSTGERQRVIEDLRWGRLDAVVCSDVFTTGINFPELASVVNAAGGQCLGPEVPVMMHDGSICPAKNVRTGDLLMGPDSKPRRVLGTTTGVGPMYEVRPTDGGMVWTCNDQHLLTVDQYQQHKKKYKVYDRKACTIKPGQRHLRMLTTAVELPDRGGRRVDPYFLGLWYGDGTKDLRSVSVTTMDPEVVVEINKIAARYSLHVNVLRKPRNRAARYDLCINRGGRNKNPLLEDMRAVIPPAGLPDEYVRAPIAARLEFLAGFLDADGHLASGSFEIVQKRRDYVDGIVRIANSLGFRVRVVERHAIGRLYWRIRIKGDCSVIPTRITRKQATRRRVKEPRRFLFDLLPIGPGVYSGFQLDGDGRFVLGDGTITHNSTIDTLQKLGRGSRIAEGKTEFEMWDVLDIDAGDVHGRTSARWLAKHARTRRRDYLKQGYEVVVVDDLVL